MKRIAWLDSVKQPSHIHKTSDEGMTTLCGHRPRDENNWTITNNIPKNIRGFSNYCRICFIDGGKSIPFIEK